jgi:hypothetical protein
VCFLTGKTSGANNASFIVNGVNANGVIQAIDGFDGGDDYVVGEDLLITGQDGQSTSATGTVTTVTAGGAIISFSLTSGGDGGQLTTIGTFSIDTVHEINVGVLGSNEYNVFIASGTVPFMSVIFNSK